MDAEYEYIDGVISLDAESLWNMLYALGNK
jgi:hypothetical protein